MITQCYMTAVFIRLVDVSNIVNMCFLLTFLRAAFLSLMGFAGVNMGFIVFNLDS